MRPKKMEAFRAFLEDWLTTSQLTQAQLSRRSGVPQNVISRWLGPEPTRPSDGNLRKLAPVVGRDYEDLLRLCGYLPGLALNQDLDPELAAINAAWPRLEEWRRKAIRTLAGSVATLTMVQPATNFAPA